MTRCPFTWQGVMRACHWLCQLPRATPHPPSKPLPAFLPSYPWDGGNAKLTPPCVVRGWPPPLLTPSLHPGAVCPSHWGTVLSRQTSQAENHRHAFSTRSGASLCFFFSSVESDSWLLESPLSTSHTSYLGSADAPQAGPWPAWAVFCTGCANGSQEWLR